MAHHNLDTLDKTILRMIAVRVFLSWKLPVPVM